MIIGDYTVKSKRSEQMPHSDVRAEWKGKWIVVSGDTGLAPILPFFFILSLDEVALQAKWHFFQQSLLGTACTNRTEELYVPLYVPFVQFFSSFLRALVIWKPIRVQLTLGLSSWGSTFTSWAKEAMEVAVSVVSVYALRTLDVGTLLLICPRFWQEVFMARGFFHGKPCFVPRFVCYCVNTQQEQAATWMLCPPFSGFCFS